MIRPRSAALLLMLAFGCRSSEPSRPDSATGDGPLPADSQADADPDGPTVIVGAPDRLVLKGTIITPEDMLTGEVLVEGNVITCVADGAACDAKPGAIGATVIDTKGIIAPGLIDTHNHILFDIFDTDDWAPAQLYQDHTQWPAEPRYQAMLDVKQCLVNDSQGKPAWCAQTPYGTSAGSLRCEVDKYGELKGLVAGTTSIVGLPGTSAACFGSLARSIDVAQNGLGMDKVQTSALFPPSSGTSVCQHFASGTTAAYLIHVGEGTDAAAETEFDELGTAATPGGCLYAPQTAITHGTAFTTTQFAAMAQAGMKLIWSPRSNVSLYGATADIPSAVDAGVTVALAPDWSLGGSVNVLDEMRFALQWDVAHWGHILTTKDLVLMATTHAAQALGLDHTLGRLEVGAIADIAVFAGDPAHPYDVVVADTPREVRLVMVGGTVLYGDPSLQAAAPAVPGCEALDVCGQPKFVCVATDSHSNKLDQTYTEIVTTLSQALADSDALTPNDGWSFSPLAPLVKCP